MNIAISALNECRRNKNQAGVGAFLAVIKGIANTMVMSLVASLPCDSDASVKGAKPIGTYLREISCYVVIARNEAISLKAE